MRTVCTVLLAAVAITAASQTYAARRGIPAPDRTINLPGDRTVQQVRNAILNSAVRRKFAIESKSDGVIILSYPLNPGKFQARFEVKYDSYHVTMHLKESSGLDQGPCFEEPEKTCIHPNVSRWMNNHMTDIQSMLR